MARKIGARNIIASHRTRSWACPLSTCYRQGGWRLSCLCATVRSGGAIEVQFTLAPSARATSETSESEHPQKAVVCGAPLVNCNSASLPSLPIRTT